MENKENLDDIVEEISNAQEDIVDAEIVDDLENQVQEESEKYKDLNDRFIRLQADFANYKRRSENERSGAFAMGVEKIAGGLLPILDNFERALCQEGAAEDSFFSGVELIYKQFLALLEKNGIEEIVALNQKFDPNLHHAVMVEERDDIEKETVVEVLQKGYKLGDRVLRPSMVKVSK